MQYNTFQEALSDLEKYPYFAYAAICAAHLAPSEEEGEHMLMLARLNICGSADSEPSSAAGTHTVTAPTTATPATAEAIDAFLSHYAPGAGLDLPPLPYSPGESLPADPGHDDVEQPIDHVIPEEKARNLIKNRKYAEALAIIEDLNLNNPEKSIYFADQIRFLKKLVIIQTKAND